jgi:hypothetical protein
MRAKDFIGKRIDVSKVGMLAFATCYQKTFDHPVIHIDLNDFDKKADTDRYSIRVDLTDNQISAIRRIGHRDDRGESAEAEVFRFPYKSLENEAQDRLRTLATELSPSSPD